MKMRHEDEGQCKSRMQKNRKSRAENRSRQNGSIGFEKFHSKDIQFRNMSNEFIEKVLNIGQVPIPLNHEIQRSHLITKLSEQLKNCARGKIYFHM